MKTFDKLREGYASYPPHNAAHASMAERGKKKKKEDTSDAVKAFLAKGGKIKKLPPAKAQGYHGKDDPGKGVAGMIDKPDTKAMGTRKKVKSMEGLTPAQKAAREKSRIGPKGEVGKRTYGSDKAKRAFHKAQRGVSGKGDNRNTMSIFDRQPKTALQGNKPKGKLPEMMSTSKGPFGVNPTGIGVKVLQKGKEVPPTPPKIGVHHSGKPVKEISKGKLGRYLKKVPASAADAGRKSAGTTGIGPDDQKKNVEKGIRKFVNSQRGTSMAVDKMTGKAKVPAK